MTRQKSEDREKAQVRRKAGVTRRFESRAGVEAIPVDEDPKQLFLFTGTAEVLAQASSDGGAGRPLGCPATRAVPKPSNKEKKATDATIDAKLISLGIRPQTAWRSVYEGRKSTWAMSHIAAVDRALRNSYWDARGLVSIGKRWQAMREQVVAPAQLTLVLG